jgi:carboxypeptidase C (cathepsin A)
MEGAFSENGPLFVSLANEGDLEYNNHTWTKLSNMLYLEAPAGVGFSYATNKQDYTTNDTQTAADNYAALQAFFADFSEFRGNEFYISGESYAGVYIPSLAEVILKGNRAGEDYINLAGILVGNGCSGTEVGVCAENEAVVDVDVEFLHGHGLYSEKLYQAIKKACGDFTNQDKACTDLLTQMGKEVSHVDIYDIYGSCDGPLDATAGPSRRSHRANTRLTALIGGPDECSSAQDAATGVYLNRADVTKALHVEASQNYWGKWETCTDKINYIPNIKNLPRDTYPDLVANLKVLIFNGDVDACVPYTDGEAWTTGMGYPVADEWHAWFTADQVSGYATNYATSGNGSFSFVTVKGSGHMVPEYKPEQALDMFDRVLNNKPF